MAEIVTFYSYKGGTGRSMALANVAWILASNGKRVLVIDWDLEAPGVHRYFMPFLPDPKLLSASSRGLINYVTDFAIQAATPIETPKNSKTSPKDGTPARNDAWYAEWAENLLRYATSLDWKFDRGGTLDFVPAGRQDRHYASLVNSFNWPNFYERLGGGTLLESIKTRLHGEFDYVLIDSRTGVSDTSGVCTVLLPTSVVVCFTLNNQSITGAVAVANSIANQRQPPGAKHPDVRIYPVPMRTDPFEKDRLAERRKFARAQFSRFKKDDAYWDDVEVAYEPYYSYEETLSTFADEPGNHRSMLASFERLTKHLSGGDGIGTLVPPDSKLRQRALRRFGARRISEASEARQAEQFDQPLFPAESTTYEISSRAVIAARLQVSGRHVGAVRYRPLRIYVSSPFAGNRADVATVHVPYEKLQPGPLGPVIEVRGDGAPRELETAPLDLDDPLIVMSNGITPTPADGRFHRQMLYAVCSLTYATFSRALGRDVAWAVSPGADEPLRLKVQAFTSGQNGGYSREAGDLSFGYYRASASGRGLAVADGLISTALDHDVIVHETTHALIDGMRSSLFEPTNADVPAFHEGFADLVALLLRFTYRDVVERSIHEASGDLTHAGLLLDLVREFGWTRGIERRPGASALGVDPQGFAALDSDVLPSASLLQYDASLDPQTLGTVFVSAIVEAFATVVRRKCERIFALAGAKPRSEPPNREALESALAREIGSVATQFLDVCIRAIDYCPPCDIEFGDYLRAVVTGDGDIEPLDKSGYREAFIRSFRRRGIVPRNVPYMTEDSARWQPPAKDLHVPELSFRRLRFNGDPAVPADEAELLRQAKALGAFVTSMDAADTPFLLPGRQLPKNILQTTPPIVQSIRTSRRVAPDGRVLFELVGEVTQTCTVARDRKLFDVTGGCTIILDALGNVRYVISKRLDNEARRDRMWAAMNGALKGEWIEVNRRQVFRPELVKRMHQQRGSGLEKPAHRPVSVTRKSSVKRGKRKSVKK